MSKVHWRAIRDNPEIHRVISYKLRGLSAEAVGKKLGIYPYKINKYLKKQAPNLNDEELYKIAEMCGVKIIIDFSLYGT